MPFLWKVLIMGKLAMQSFFAQGGRAKQGDTVPYCLNGCCNSWEDSVR